MSDPVSSATPMGEVGFTAGPLAVWPSLYEGYGASVVVDGSDPLRTLAQVREYRDALLYAAAPELYEALKAMLEAYSCTITLNGVEQPDDDPAHALARAALSKAEGRS